MTSHLIAQLSVSPLRPAHLGRVVSARLQTEAAFAAGSRGQTEIDVNLDVNDAIDRLPPEVVENLPLEVLEGLQDGTLSEIPTDIMDNLQDRLPADVLDRVPAEFLSDPTNRLLIGILGAVALVSFAGFLYGVMKSAMKAAFFFAVVAVIAAVVLYTNAL